MPAKPHLPLLASAALLLTFAAQLPAQSSSSSSSQSGTAPQEESRSTPKRPSVEAGGSAVTLETSEPLFYLASALNLCGYDDGLDQSDPVRAKVRADIESAAIATPEAADSRRALCEYVHTHQLTDAGLNLAQYVSLALYVTPPPELAPAADETDLPPDSTQVVNILPLLRTFAEQVHLHAIWIKYRPEYEALIDLVHDPLTRTILNTNIYLKLPASSYDGRRFLVLLEPMLAPAATNARIYGNDYTVVVSPLATPPGTVKMEQIRHTYLHYEVEPLVYSRATAMNRLQPLLRTVQDAPIDFNYKSDIVSLITECMIKAIEAHTMDVGLPKPVRPESHERVDQERYTGELAVYDRQTEAARRSASDLAMRQGWVLTGYFYDALNQMQRDGSSLKDAIGQMVYGMDIGREAHHDQQITFLPETTHDVVRRAPRQPIGLDLAEMKLFKGDKDGASEIAEKVLASPTGDHARANYLIARINLLDQEPDDAVTHFHAALETSRDPRTLAWCHIYLGRLYDMQQTPDRKKAVAEYHLALNLRDDRPDTKAAAEAGIRAPFAPPKREAMPDTDDNTPVDPTGKAEKDAYKPPPPQ
ncbi:tetratricopeptide (TPR) repeat protein [Granulicella aggregans]|uniref:Tetratricopeptide (TPR) repeat protein n=1 Tax=Granulicella aggregans TaxID=474949 RepID=A0A7W7ZF49_9BACT|nr:tetratricopeptide (TPR) repeat protein [Granulicella aggregans]